MPEVVLRIAGTNATAIRTIRETVAELHGVRIETEKIGAANREIQPSIAETARLNVTKAIEQREALKGLVTEYGAIGKAAAAGSEEARTAHRLEMESNAKLAATYDEVGVAAKRAGSEAVAASARAREESGVARGFASRTFGLSAFAGGAFIAGAAAGVVIKKAADEAQRAQESQAQLQNALDRTGQSWDRQGASIERYLVRAEKASSFDRIDLRTSLGQLIRTTGDTAKAQDLLSQATDVARGRHISLDTAVRLVTRAYQGSVGSLARLGIHIAAVTTAQDALRAAHVKTTPEMVKQAKEIDRQATATAALKRLNDLYSGSAEAHARTLAGHEEQLGNALTDVSVAIGSAVTPALSRMFEWMAKTIEAATSSRKVHEVLHATFKVIGEAIGLVVSDLKFLYNIYESVAHIVHSQLAPALAITLVAALYAVRDATISVGSIYTAIAVLAFIAVSEIIKHWGTVKRWFGDFWGYMKDTARAAWETIIQIGRSAVYVMLQAATAGIRGILEVASHLPFVGDTARRALDSINNYISKWKPDFSNVTKAFSGGGKDAGQAFVDAMNASLKGGFTTAITAGTFVPGHRAGPRGERTGASISTGGVSGVQAGLISTGATALGVPYRYGGTPSLSSPTDCSGLMVAIFAQHGIRLPRTSEEQYAQAPIKPGRRILPGDLVFSEGIHPGHVGLYVGSGNVLEDPHTGDHVKVVPLSGFGWNGESARWWAAKAKATPKGGGHDGAATPALPSIADVIAQGQPQTSTAHHVAAAVTLTALGVPSSLQNAIAKAADEARNAIAKGHYDAAIDFYKQERADLEKEAADLRRKLRDPKLTAGQRATIHKDLTTVGNEIRDVGGEITKAHNAIAKAVHDQLTKEKATLQASVSAFQSQVSSAWSSVSQGIVSAFEAQTQSLIDAVGKQFFQGVQTPQEAALTAAQAADQVQSLQDAIANAATPEDRAAAQHQLDLYNLEQAATASRVKADQDYADAVAAIRKQRQDEEERLTVALGKFGDGLQGGTRSFSELQPLLDQYGINLGSISDGSFIFKSNLDDLSSSTTALDQQFRALAILLSAITGKPVNLPPAGGGGGGGGGGGVGGGACFVAGTLVSTPTGETPIEELHVGSVVYVYDFARDALVETLVIGVDRHEGGDERDTLAVRAGGRDLVGTYEHRVWDGDDWTPLGETTRLWRPGSAPLPVEAVVPGQRVPVYNLHVVHPDHNYVANGFLVHNVKQHFAGGGIVAGPLIGPEDTVTAAVSGGEGVLSRDEMRMLLTAAIGGRTTTTVSTRPIYVLGATKDEVGRALARIITPAQRRSVGFKDY